LGSEITCPSFFVGVSRGVPIIYQLSIAPDLPFPSNYNNKY